VDDATVNSGSLLTDMEPSINPPKEIDDPEDFKPADWDDREKIPDPDATKVSSHSSTIPVGSCPPPSIPRSRPRFLLSRLPSLTSSLSPSPLDPGTIC